MKLLCRGANREVTGSRHLLQINGKQILLDCGLYQGRRSEEREKNANFGFDPKTIDAVLISHAHMDHAGNLPNLVKQGFNGPIYATSATRDLLEYMLKDSAYIQEREIEYVNRKAKVDGTPEILPLYTIDDVERTLPLLKPIEVETCLDLGFGVKACFNEAGHILGSAIITLTVDDQEDGQKKTFVFSGDLGRKNLPLIKDPYQVEAADILMIESTYGNRLHESILEAEDKLAEIVNETAKHGGKILIPAFSLGRTQEVVFSLHRLSDAGRIPNIPIYVDSPLSVNVTEVFKKHAKGLDEEAQVFLDDDKDPLGFKSLKYIQSVEESKALNNHNGPCVIVASSGMVEHGRILHHLKNAIEDHRNTLLIVGFQAQNTLGRKLLEGQKEVNIFGEPYVVKIQVKVMNAYSAHADRSDLLSYVSKVKGLKKIILVHGEEQAALDLQTALKPNTAAEILVPSYGDEVSL